MNRTLLNFLTWGTIASAVVCALLLAAAVDDLDPSVRPSSRHPGAAPADAAALRTPALERVPANAPADIPPALPAGQPPREAERG